MAPPQGAIRSASRLVPTLAWQTPSAAAPAAAACPFPPALVSPPVCGRPPLSSVPPARLLPSAAPPSAATLVQPVPVLPVPSARALRCAAALRRPAAPATLVPTASAPLPAIGVCFLHE
jgi:hypothetical protein